MPPLSPTTPPAPLSSLATHPAAVAVAQRRAQSGDRLLIGASWYPEMWPETEWEADLQKMRELRFTAVRLFEFAWVKLEPADGVFDFGWARRVLDLCHRYGVAVQIGTPTAAPPLWLTEAHPEVLKVRLDGVVQRHGQRLHYNPHSPTYRRFAARIAGELARAFGQHPALHSWQIDNEMSGSDYSAATLATFRHWLEQRYGTIEGLNAAWGLDFWSQRYARFDQIEWPLAGPGQEDSQIRPHPSLALAMKEFQNTGWAGYLGAQIAAIREHSAAPITSNMTDSVTMDWFAHNQQLDRVGFSLYRDLAHYHFNIRNFDRMRAEKDAPFYFPETAPNWSGGGPIWNIHMHAAGIQTITWMGVFLGSSLTLYWQWRQHWAGQEMNHGTHVSATGQWRPNRAAWQRLGEAFAEHGEWLLAHPPAPAPMAVMESNQSRWVYASDPMDLGQFDYLKTFRDELYQPLVEHQWWRDVIGPAAALDRYRLVVVPLQPILPPAMRAALAEFVAAGGHLVLGPGTGLRTTEFTVPRDRTFGGLEDLMGADSALGFPSVWVEDRQSVVWADAAVPPAQVRHWCEAVTPRPGTAVLGRFVGGYGDGLAAVTRCRHASGGTVTYVGGLLDRQSWARLVGECAALAGLAPVAEAPAGVLVIPRVNAANQLAAWAVLNLTEQPHPVALPGPTVDRLSGTARPARFTLAPLEALVLQPVA